ncbi:pectinesterase [Musa troglodytarum]|uniref:Pectinesterase n=1 Tax=Musa troglodytarum TaxID=320322 RepID=A0A9E7KCU6_9LILI|nr:pectinesterase [Musa troglodytarum]
MATLLANLIILYFNFLLVLKVAANDPISRCNQTPHPQVCSSMLENEIAEFISQSDFRDVLLRATTARTVLALRQISSVDMTQLDKPAKAALANCLELYNDTISRLQLSMRSSSSIEDSQTWLSAAKANERTCRDGFVELGSTFPLEFSSFVTNHLSESLSNMLAVNMATPRDKPPPKNRRLLSHGIPQWVKAADRKLIQAGLTIKPDLVVAKDGSGNYNTISEATVDITTNMQNLMMIGDGKDDTIVTGSKNFVDGTPTFNTATFSVNGDGFIAQDIGFENTAGPEKHQAVALRSSADRSVFYRCSFKGYQDTLYIHTNRQWYRNCDIYGTKNTVTSHGRDDFHENTGIVMHAAFVMAAPDLKPVQGSFQTFLGRPWRQYSRTVYLLSRLDDLIDPAGWHAWNETMSVSNLYYAEFQSKGDRADTSKRVNWPGYHVLTTDQEAEPFTAGNFLSGDSWVLATGVPYASGLYGYDVGGNN